VRRPPLLALLVLIAFSACAGSDGDADGGGPTATSTTAAPAATTTTTIAGSEGCGEPAPAPDADRLVRATVDSSGGSRAYMVYVPETYDQAVPAPVAYVFHGATSNKEQQLAYSHYQPYADADGALLVLPDALGEPSRWSPFGPAFAGVEGVDDLVFFDDLSAAIEGELCVDPERVLVSGMSSGGFMAAAVACTRSDRVTAAGPVTATVWAEAVCSTAEPVAYAYFHGTDDAVVPYDGGANSPGPVEETSQAWADQNGCAAAPTDESVGTEVVHRSWSGCDASTDLYIVEGGGHTWPGAVAIGGFGYTTDDIDASALIWETFRAAWPAGRDGD
jgi:polyhydroxybutyrate depolymerase